MHCEKYATQQKHRSKNTNVTDG